MWSSNWPGTLEVGSIAALLASQMDLIFMYYLLLLYYCQVQARVDIFVIVYVKNSWPGDILLLGL